MNHRHFTAEINELIVRTSLVTPTGVIKCRSDTHIPFAEKPYNFPGFVRRKQQTHVVVISFLDFLEFIANDKYVTEVFSVTEVLLRL